MPNPAKAIHVARCLHCNKCGSIFYQLNPSKGTFQSALWVSVIQAGLSRQWRCGCEVISQD